MNLEYINNNALEALVFLLFNNEPYKIHSFWVKQYSLDKNKKFNFVRYFNEIGVSDAVEAGETDDLITVKLKDINKLKPFLKKYLTLYKQGELEPNSEVNYFSYSRNLEFAEKVLTKFSQNLEVKNIVLTYFKICNPEQESDFENKRFRLLEFILDCYFQGITHYIEVKNCKRQVIKLAPLHETLAITLKLNKQPQELYEFLVSRKSDWDVFLEKTDDYEKEKITEDRWVTKRRKKINLKGRLEVKYKKGVLFGTLKTQQNWEIFKYLLERNGLEIKKSDVIYKYTITPRNASRPPEKALYTYISDIKKMLNDVHSTEKNYIKTRGDKIYPKIP